MSATEEGLPLPRLMNPGRARDIGRAYKALADSYEAAGDRVAFQREMRRSEWWLAYAIALAQTPPSSEYNGLP